MFEHFLSVSSLDLSGQSTVLKNLSIIKSHAGNETQVATVKTYQL
jgi:hypothetical protein